MSVYESAWVEPEIAYNGHIIEQIDEIGFSVRHFPYVDEAHEIFRHEKFGLILMESDLPGYTEFLKRNEFSYDAKSGLFLLQNSIRTQGSPNIETPVIVLSLHGLHNLVAEYRRQKPIKFYDKHDLVGEDSKLGAIITDMKNVLLHHMRP